MSRSASAMRDSPETFNLADANNVGRTRHERSSKGRRRRAAAEQRRIDQQRWGQYLTDEEEDSGNVVPATVPRSSNRRRARRNNRNNSNSVHFLEDDYCEDEVAFHATRSRDELFDDFDLEMALSLSLSLSSASPNNSSNQSNVNMSYETLVQLESVKCVAPTDVVSSMLDITFDGNKSEQGLATEMDKCAICQCEYECGEHIISLPCTHGFHYACGSEWLLNYSKLCPICKIDVTDTKFTDM
uniref:RING-type E3 ubiquitin transferase n=1 Tax=Araucaria cunninghamii TaxID=56994 RepID=A0A0D6R0M7_ARACU